MRGVFAKNEPELWSCESGTPGYSFYFDLIAPLWRNCKAEGAIHRLCSLMRKMGARTLVKEEELDPDQELRDEFDDLTRRVGAPLPDPPKAVRISFFAAPCPPDKSRWRELLPEDSFLGYAVIVQARVPPDAESARQHAPSGELAYVLEAVARPPGWACEDQKGRYAIRGATNYYVHCQRTFKTTIGPKGSSKEYTLNGAFFCQQNGLTHVCAHAALRMILNTGKGLVDHKVTNREVNEILGIDHEQVTVQHGLSPEQILTVPNRLGINVLGADFIALPAVDYAEWAYPLVESGYSVLLAFNPTHAEGHVVALIGHTMNSDKWDCEAHLAYRPEAFGTYHASAAWVDHFIINDDNFGMYTCMPPSYLRSKVLPQYDRTQRAAFALGFLPAGVDVPPYSAEKAAVALVRQLQACYQPPSENRWLERIWVQLREPQKGIVARTLGRRTEEYVKYLGALVDSEGKPAPSAIPDAIRRGSEHLWVTEVSLPDLYTANKRKLGDVLVDAEASRTRGQPLLRYRWGWLPGLQIPQNPGPGVMPAPWPLTGHVPVLRQSQVLGPYQEW